MSLSLTGKHWLLRHGKALGTSLVQHLLEERGISPKSAAQRDEIPINPYLFPDIQRVVARIQHAIQRHEGIAIAGDYDCDGITATTQLLRAFRRRGLDPLIHLPHRIHDGYGLKENTIDVFHSKGIHLLITVDTGITALAAITKAKTMGMDVIVIDHHAIPESLPPAFAFLHPALSSLPPPHPAATGVVFSLLSAWEGSSWPENNIDCALASIGTIADLVPLLGCNRLLVTQGLEAFGKIREGPLALLREQAGLMEGKTLSSSDIAFRIAPRINAAGRMADPRIALDALIFGGSAVTQLEELNLERQRETLHLFESITHALDSHDIPPFICIIEERISPGIMGLIAGKLTQHYGRPSLVGSIQGTLCTASLRSTPLYDIVDALQRYSHYFESFGGHAQAAGCTFSLRVIDHVREALTSDVRSTISPENLRPTIAIDAILHPNDISLRLCEELQELDPFGQGNPEPRFLLQNISLNSARQMGSDRSHLQGFIGDTRGIGFGLGSLFSSLSQPLDLVCRLGINEWQGRRSPQIYIEDMRPAITSDKCLSQGKERDQHFASW